MTDVLWWLILFGAFAGLIGWGLNRAEKRRHQREDAEMLDEMRRQSR